jgi:hypothetical protein
MRKHKTQAHLGRWLVLGLAVAMGCGDKDDDDDDDDDTGSDDTGSDTGEPDGLPASPLPMTVNVSGALSQSITFDDVDCTHPIGSSNLRIFYRGSGHVFVLKAEILGDYTGPGTYESGLTNTRVSLQEEAGGSATYFAADADQGDTVSVVIDGHDTEAKEAWGSFSVSGMHDNEGGTATMTPMPLPIWCPAVD